LTPTAIGASPEGTGAPSLTPLVVKITNLCPYTGNEVWCAYDINSFGYEAHFDLMDYNMDGLISSMGWNNPEVTYQEVDCATNGYVNWGCECADESSGESFANSTSAPTPTQAVTSAPTQAASALTEAATSAPTEEAVPGAANIIVQVNGGSSTWWFGFSVATATASDISTIEVMDSGGAIPNWTLMTYQGNDYWNMYSVSPSTQMSTPLSLRFTATNGQVVIASNIITSFQAVSIDTGVAV